MTKKVHHFASETLVEAEQREDMPLVPVGIAIVGYLPADPEMKAALGTRLFEAVTDGLDRILAEELRGVGIQFVAMRTDRDLEA